MDKLNLFSKSQFHKKIFLLLLCIISVGFIYFYKHYIVNTILQTSPVNDVEDDNFMMLTSSNTSGGLVNISLDSLPKESTTSPFTQASRLPNHGRRLVRSTWLPIRGPGDSDMPFEDEFEPTVEEFPKDLFKEKPIGVDPKDPYNPPLKKILFWNDFFNVKHFEFGFGQEPFLRAGCQVNTCMTTGDRTRFAPEELDAVIWHPRASDRSLPSMRSPHTHYVFWMMESASYLNEDIKKYDKVFNWTFTYRLDSDFPNPYGMVYRRRDPLPAMDIQNIITSTKTKLVAWFVSNCQTAGGREKYVNSLKTWIEVDIYGKCGQLKCSRNVQFTHCYKMLERDYKFYLSFENSLCQDYVTEKLFNILRLNVVPVVYGLANYSMQAPPRSYINALDFSTPKDLADYLLYLNKNDTAYNEYFLWKSYHFMRKKWAKVAKPYCDMCERLHENHTAHAYDLDQWFREESHCRNSL